MAPRLLAEGIPELLPMGGRSGDPRRHVSSVIRALCIKFGHFDPRDESSQLPEETVQAILDGRLFRSSPQTMWELGSAFEWAVEDALCRRWASEFPHRFARVGELFLDGMYGTPDLIDMVDDAVVEIKLTWMSSNQPPDGDKFWKYWTQGKCYAKMLGLSKVHLHVGHINGDWKFTTSGPNPIYRVWEDIFTPKTLDLNWRMIRSHSDRMISGS